MDQGFTDMNHRATPLARVKLGIKIFARHTLSRLGIKGTLANIGRDDGF